MPLSLTILVGTMTGTAEMVAQEVQQALESSGHQVELRMMDGLDAGAFADGGIYLICTSTYGFGAVPDNAQDLLESLESVKPDLSHTVYGIIALGDRTYVDTFCFGGRRFDEMLSSLGARRAGDMMEHDAGSEFLPEEVAPEWALAWVKELDTSDAASSAQTE